MLASFVETTKRFYTCSLYNSKTFVYIPTTLREQYFYRVWKQCASVAERGSNGPPPIKLIIKQGKSSLIELTSKSNDASINREMLETRGVGGYRYRFEPCRFRYRRDLNSYSEWVIFLLLIRYLGFFHIYWNHLRERRIDIIICYIVHF